MAKKKIPPELEGLADLKYGIGENADGTINTFPASELNRRTIERALEEADDFLRVDEDRE